MKHTPIDFHSLRRTIKKSEDAEELIICEESDEDILTDDLTEDQLRLINYHMVKPTAEWLRSLVFCGSSCKEEVERDYLDTSIRLLLNVDQNMLVTLRHIIFVASEDDMHEALKALDAEVYEWPECVFFDGDDVGECLGCFWRFQSAIIINIAAIRVESAALVEEYEFDDDYWHEDESELVTVGVYETLLHELRHLGLDNPFLDEDEYPIAEAAEDAVEDWAREAYEAALYSLPC